MKKIKLLLGAGIFSLIAMSATCNKESMEKTTTTVEDKMVEVSADPPSRYDYETVPGDPLNVRTYTLKNGLKVYLSVNKDAPRVMTNIAVRAGSKHDPADATGLAHYLEHMLFKGTSEIGSLDWETEKVLLQEISDLYEQHRGETDPAKRKEIYNQIDQKSNEAAKYVAANEYDKMIASLGAKGTNAYTYVEQTVYVNDIPSNELEKWMKIESERFSQLVLRLFHTELEAVYEEFNISQDVDTRKGNKAISEALFPNHPYGLQTTIGKGEHLKNPSHVKIHEYFDTYYHPNNMAIVLSGDLDPDKTIAMVEKYFGDYEPQDIPAFTFGEQPELTEPVYTEILGQQEEYVDFAFRVDNKDHAVLKMLNGILYNQKAGLVDINLVQKQKVLEGDAWMWDLEDYNVFGMYGKPKAGQTLEEVKDLLLGQIEKVKAGEFDEWLMAAAIKEFKLQEMKASSSNQARVGTMTDAFIKGVQWKDYVNFYDEMAKLTKQDVIDFTKRTFKDNYVCIYKRTGEDKSVFKVEKPTITPISVNREQASKYVTEFMKLPGENLKPVFVDFKKEIQSAKLPNGIKLDYIKNTDNGLFSLNYIVDMGKANDKMLPIAMTYLPYLGTSKYSAEALQQEFFKLGLDFEVFSGEDQAYVTLSGLEESLEEGVKLFEHILANVEPDATALEGVINNIITKRANNKKDKRFILRNGLGNYARYGTNSSFLDKLSEKDLKAIKPEQLVKKIKELTSFQHDIFFYGKSSIPTVSGILAKYHTVPASLKPIPAPKKYEEVSVAENMVYFVDFPMVQAEVLKMSKGSKGFQLEEYVMAELYNNYFGFGLSSIMFQEIRESKALAYSTYAYYSAPSDNDKSHFLQAYVGTQVDKLKDAVTAVDEILENMPVSEGQIESARQSILKKIETERITKSSKYWTAKANKKKGLDRDIRSDVYEQMKEITPADLQAFQQKNVKGRKFAYLVMGDKKSVDMDFLKTLGAVKELTIEEVLGY